jgi:hypothetical protein
MFGVFDDPGLHTFIGGISTYKQLRTGERMLSSANPRSWLAWISSSGDGATPARIPSHPH